jgi:hypothetical protein
MRRLRFFKPLEALMDPNVDSDSKQEARDFATATASSPFSTLPAADSVILRGPMDEIRDLGADATGRDPLPEHQSHAENTQHSPSSGWSAYDVWYTQVRAVQIARSRSMPTALFARAPDREGYSRTSCFSEAARNVALMLGAWWLP